MSPKHGVKDAVAEDRIVLTGYNNFQLQEALSMYRVFNLWM